VGGHTMLLLAAIALEAPWLQGIGRARCLVQGCCHGAPSSEALGIRYWRDRSRVCALADLRGVALHPTPLYSMLTNVVTGILLLRLWSLGAAPTLIAGGYLLLAGAARFVEESYRGEPQTLIIGGLRIYQWLAIVSFVMGAFLTTLPPGVARLGGFHLDGRVVVTALTYGLICWFAMGVDFPGSSRRFARLAAP
jgi:prolipoprotein diacylglyceryltransferase